jgi:hypothetical protein
LFFCFALLHRSYGAFSTLLTVYLDGYIYSPSVYSDHDIAGEHTVEDRIYENHIVKDHIVATPVVEEQRYAKNVTFKGKPLVSITL